MPAAKKSASKPEPEEEVAPVFDEPVDEVEEKPAEADVPPQSPPASAAPEPAVHAGGHVLTEDKGWVPEEES